VRPGLRHFVLAFAAAALLHVGGAAALLSGTDAGDGPGHRGGLESGLERGGTGGHGLRFSLGHGVGGGGVPKPDATTPDSAMDIAQSEQPVEVTPALEDKSAQGRPTPPALVRPVSSRPPQTRAPEQLATPDPPIPHDTTMAAARQQSERELGRSLSEPPSVSAPPPEDDLVRLASARVSDSAIQQGSALPQSPAAERDKGSSGVESGSGTAAGLGISGGGLSAGGQGNDSGGSGGGEGTSGGGGAGSGLLSSAEGRNYYLDVSQKVSRNLRYPSRAQREGLEGRVLVSVRIDRKGELLECELGESSGARYLDRDALRTVRRAAPFGAVPGSIEGRGLEFDVPVVYGLD